jgi:tetratricopeptide (TPR) repeat protein
MKYTTFVAFLLLAVQGFAGEPPTVQAIESEWATIYYRLPKSKQEDAYNSLLEKTGLLLAVSPDSSEALFWQAVIIATKAELQDGFTALKAINKSRDLLLQAININSNTANGSAYVTLGMLYYMAPKWPIAFGDDEKAEQMLKSALKINPQGIDVNYFFGDFLLTNNRAKEAVNYFEKAASLPSRPGQRTADDNLKNEAKLALLNEKNRKLNGTRNAFLSLFTSASID